jgi:hypothetical protein
MISLIQIRDSVIKCNINKNLKLPEQNKDFIQQTAYDFRIKKLENNLMKITKKIEEKTNFSIENEFKLDNQLEKNDMSYSKVEKNIPSKSLIVITENATIDIPEIINDLFKNYNSSYLQSFLPNNSLYSNSNLYDNSSTSNIDIDKLYLFGFKNPDSFYKSLLTQISPEFITKNKIGIRNDISSFKNEIIVKLDTFYKKLNYKAYKINKTSLGQNLNSIDNYANYDLFLYLADYLLRNILIIDIIDMKYSFINYQPNKINKIDDPDNIANDNITYNLSSDVLVFIKYTNETYLPLMSSASKSNYNINENIVDTLKSMNFEEEIYDKFSIRKNISNNDEDVIINNANDTNDIIDIGLNNDNDNDNNDDDDDNNDDNDDNNESIKSDENNVSNGFKLLSLKDYNLEQLQDLCNKNNINIKKQGKSKEINKTKNELYNELKLLNQN